MEQEKKLEEERRMRERSDNWRERGLDQMMGGVLEIKKEDELKKVVSLKPVACFITLTLITAVTFLPRAVVSSRSF